MLDQSPIFLGGQGGMVGPVRIAYGTVVAAGVICRRDILEPDHLVFFPSPSSSISKPFTVGAYGSMDRVVRNSLIYLGQHSCYG